MAFGYPFTGAAQKVFGLIATGLGINVWRYGDSGSLISGGVNPNTDTFIQMLAAGYFNAAGYLLNIGDIIFARDTNGIEVKFEVVGNSNLPILTTTAPPPPPTPSGIVVVAVCGGTMLYQDPTPSTSATTGSDATLKSFSLPGSLLTRTGDKLRVRAYFQCAANANNKIPKLTFGATALVTAPTAATNAKNGFLEATIVKTGASAQLIEGGGLVDVTPVTTLINSAGAEVDTSAIIVAFKNGSQVAASDVICNDLEILKVA